MIEKQDRLVKILFIPPFAKIARVVNISRRHFWDRLRELPDWQLILRLPVSFQSFLIFLTASSLFTSCSFGQLDSSTGSGMRLGIRPDKGCTIFYAADEDTALAGNNEDYSNPYTFVWFVPPSPGKYGRVYFGYEDGFPQGGVNEKGLFLDGSSLQKKLLDQANDKPVYDESFPPENLIEKIVSESATVPDALAILETYSHVGMDTYQLLIGDARGDSFIVDGNDIILKQDRFQIATNFRLSQNPDPPYPCWRYTTALEQLSNADTFSVELFRDILDATHQELPNFPTLYSNVYDLKNGLIYLYYNHDFENVVVIDVAEELAKGFHYQSLVSLFPDNTAAAEYQAQRQKVFSALNPPLPTSTGQLLVAGYTGDYRVGETKETLSIYEDAGRLFFWQHHSMPIELHPLAEDQFFHSFSEWSNMKLNFQRDDQGSISGAMGVLYGVRFDLQRLGTTLQGVQSSPVPPAPETSPPSPNAPPSPTTTAPPAPAEPEITAPHISSPMPVADAPTSILTRWGWVLAALGLIAVAIALWAAVKR